MESDQGLIAEKLVAKTKHHLFTTMGRVVHEASDEEFYRALSYAFREEIMINWLACIKTQEIKDERMLYYISMEYLPGRIFSNNITNLASNDIVHRVLQKMNRSLRAIISKESDPGLGNGGLGRLASCFLDSLATHHYPAQAYGLRYQYGIFEQQIKNGLQIETPDGWLLSGNPWEFRRDLRKVDVRFSGSLIPSKNIHGDEIFTLKDEEEVWVLPFDIPITGYSKTPNFSIVTLRLWSTKEYPRNFHLQSYNAGHLERAAENTTLTDVLYPNDDHETGKRIRLKQEFLLVSSSVQDILRHYIKVHHNLRSFSDKVRIQINDTHPALVIPELIRLLISKHEIPWKTAVEITQQVVGYTNHTILSEALEEWSQGLMQYLLPRQYRIIDRLNSEFCSSLRIRYPNNEEKVRKLSIIEDGRVRMANLAIVGSYKINGVSKLHSDILKTKVFKDFYELFPGKFENVTNGVTQRRWLLHCNPELALFISERIGKEWITDFSQIHNLAAFASDPESQENFLAIKRRNKLKLIEYINYPRMHNSEDQINNFYDKTLEHQYRIDVDSLFDVQIKRIHEYKRQLLNILHVIALYFEILDNPHSERVKRTMIFGGKAAPGYDTAKDIIRLISCVARTVNGDPKANWLLNVVYVPNYKVSSAEIIIPAADISEQISQAGMEASGTGNMKLSINGALTVGTDDGANVEMKEAVTEKWWPFIFGANADEIQQLKDQNSYHPAEIYQSDPVLKRVLDSLKTRVFAINDSEHHTFSDLFHKLIEGHYGGQPDRYFNLHDFRSYYEIQKKVEDLYRKPALWAEYAIHNIAGMGNFSSDAAVKNYAEKIWGITPQSINQEILDNIKHAYSPAGLLY